MGTLSEIFAARQSDAAAYGVAQVFELAAGKNSYSALRVRGVTPVELGLLWALLEKKPWSGKRHAFLEREQVAFDDPGLPKSVRKVIADLLKLMNAGNVEEPYKDESVLFCFPQDFVDLLVKIDAKSLPAVAKRWQQQLKRRKVAEWPHSFASRILKGVVSRAGRVRPRGPQLFVWLSP
jgi:hypothetical protein